MSEAQRPQVSVGHVTLNTPCLEASSTFMLTVGMTSVYQDARMAIFELRGGTHLLLFRSEQPNAGAASFDLMVDDLAALHARIAASGYAPSGIKALPEIGHETFDVQDPSGAVITFYSSHATCAPG